MAMFIKLENETLIISHGDNQYTILHESGFGATIKAVSKKAISIDNRYQAVFYLDDTTNHFVHVECVTLDELDRVAEFLGV